MREKIYINDTDLQSEYGLLLANKEISVPERQLLTLEIPGRDGLLDITDQLYSEPKYRNRTIEVQFMNLRNVGNSMTWPELLTAISTEYHGELVQIQFSSDMDYYYVGRCSIEFEEHGGNRGIAMKFDCDPYKYSVSDPSEKTL